MAKAIVPVRLNLNYGLHRVIYDIEVAATAILVLPTLGRHDPLKDVLKIAALIMARNLNDFLYFTSQSKPDDLLCTHFDLKWSPDSTKQMSKALRDRIGKIAGHIVGVKPKSFGDSEVASVTRPLIGEAAHFVMHCRHERKAGYVGNAGKFVTRTNKVLDDLKGLPMLPAK